MYSTYIVISSTEFRKIRILNTTVGVPVKCLECRMGLKNKGEFAADITRVIQYPII